MELATIPASILGMYLMTSDTVRKANPNCAETFASLRLYGDQLVPEEISRLLGTDPSDSAPKGLQTASPSGKSRIASTGRWILQSCDDVASANLEDHIAWLLDRLDKAGIEPDRLPGVGRADVFCYWSSASGHGGPELSPDVLARLARYRLPLGLDIYFVST
jgi:Domain of unknown function (DUF4279)